MVVSMPLRLVLLPLVGVVAGPVLPVDVLELPATVSAPTLLKTEYSVESLSEMRPLESTTGVKPRPTPNCL